MGLGGLGGAGPEGPPNVTEGAGQAPPPTGCLRPYSSYLYLPTEGLHNSPRSLRLAPRPRRQRRSCARHGSLLPIMEQMKSGKSKNIDDGIWQDREIRFDTKMDQLEMRSGELQIDSINSVEDTKGNNGEKGSLSITNLRLIWICHRNSRINLSIGYNAVVSINIRTANSRLRGNTQANPAATAAATRTQSNPGPHPNLRGDSQALYVMTKFNNSRFEFVFTNLVRQSPRLFTTVQAVYRAYDTSRLYRYLKLRGAIIRNKSLILLPNEQMYNKVPHTTHSLPPTTCHLPPATCHIPHTTYHVPHTTYLPTTYS